MTRESSALAQPTVAVFSIAEHREHGFLIASINDAAMALLTAGSISALGESINRLLAPDLAELISHHARECLEFRRPVAFTTGPTMHGGKPVAYLMTPLGNESRLVTVTALPCGVINRLPLLLSEQQRLATLGYLSRGVAHDVTNILMSARLALGDAERGIPEGSVTRQRLAVVHNALALTPVLLEKVVACSAEPDTDRGTVDLNVIVSDAVNLL